MRAKESEALVGRFDGLRVDPRKLKLQEGYNVRDLDAPAARQALDVLKESIREKGGVMTPYKVRMIGADMFIEEGHRRQKVVLELIDEGMDIQYVPAIIAERRDGDAERTLNLVLSNSGEPLTEPEKAEVVRRLLNMGWSKERIRNRMGYKTQATIANFELWLSAPSEVKQAVRTGEVAYSTAVEIVRHANGDDNKARETLSRTRETTKARGKKRITAATVAAEKKPAAPRNQLNVDKALAALADVVANNYAPAVAASVFMALPAATVSQIAEWVYEFEDRLKAREDERREPRPIVIASEEETAFA